MSAAHEATTLWKATMLPRVRMFSMARNLARKYCFYHLTVKPCNVKRVVSGSSAFERLNASLCLATPSSEIAMQIEMERQVFER
jgi:hypothetical protein